MSQKQIHRANRKLRKEMERARALSLWALIVSKRLNRWPWRLIDRVFKITPRPGKYKVKKGGR